MWIADNSLPYVSLQMMIKTGSSQDPAGKEGIAGFTADLLDKGTTGRGALRISEDLDQIGSSFDVSVQPDYMVATSSSLSFNKDEVLRQFREILLTPSFPSAEIERQRQLVLAGMSKLADQSEDFTEYLLPRFLYGEAHPYGHSSMGTPKSIRALARMDILGFYKQHFTPGNAVLAVVGQYDEAWKHKVEKVFGAWAAHEATKTEIADFPQWKGVESLVVDRSDLNQAQIQIAFKGVPRDIPEYMDVRAALKILGESFGSRLFDEIRVRRGLTYGINSWFDPRLKPGPMGIHTFTRIEKAGETVEQTLNTYREFVKNGVTAEEVATVKALIHGQFPRMVETAEALARQLLILNRYGVSSAYLSDYLQNVDAVSKDSVNAAIHKYFDPDNLRILVYAPAKSVEPTLKKLGSVKVESYKTFLQ
jgi:zinc protease